MGLIFLNELPPFDKASFGVDISAVHNGSSKYFILSTAYFFLLRTLDGTRLLSLCPQS